jgi:hypothetical protein
MAFLAGLRRTLYSDRLRSRKLVFTVSFPFIAATWLFPFVVRGVRIRRRAADEPSAGALSRALAARRCT